MFIKVFVYYTDCFTLYNRYMTLEPIQNILYKNFIIKEFTCKQ